MKTTIDTNIFLYATISKKCAIKVSETYKKGSYNIILRSVNEETKPKLQFLFTVLTILRYEAERTRNALKLIDSDFYDTLKNKYPQIYKAIRNYVVKNKINSKKKTGRFIEVLDFILNDIRFLVKIISDAKRAYPVTEEKYKRIKNSKIFKSCIDSLKEIIKKNDMDRIHIGLCNHYLFENLKYTDKLVFITIDKNDFIKHNNKEKIEKIIKNLIIDTLPSLDVENIIL